MNYEKLSVADRLKIRDYMYFFWNTRQRMDRFCFPEGEFWKQALFQGRQRRSLAKKHPELGILLPRLNAEYLVSIEQAFELERNTGAPIVLGDIHANSKIVEG